MSSKTEEKQLVAAVKSMYRDVEKLLKKGHDSIRGQTLAQFEFLFKKTGEARPDNLFLKNIRIKTERTAFDEEPRYGISDALTILGQMVSALEQE